jgi:acyl-CoA reductase-like NAD-dependent aldehyde dehydrogenase
MTEALFPDVVPNMIGGTFAPAAIDDRIEVINPHDGSVIARIPNSSAKVVNEAVEAARRAQPGWAATPGVQRGDVLHRIANAMEERKEELARIVALEAGKRMPDALGEAGAAIQCARFFAGEGQRLFGRTTTSGLAGRWAMTVRQPCGVAGLIIAANTPAPNFAWKVFPALICGNGVVLKSAEDTPISSWFLGRLAEAAGLPKGLLNVVHGAGEVTGSALVEHPGVDVLSFTGSTRVGRVIAESAGRQLKKLSLELGGKNPLVVCEDADLDNAARWAGLAAFSNAGQRCAAGSRIIIVNGVFDAFVEKFVATARALKLGIADDCDLGPVINARQLAAMLDALKRAVANGARVLCGGTRANDASLAKGFYMQPTILADLDPDAELSTVELFGPIVNVYRAADFDDALALANRSPYGLTASIHTRDVDRALVFAERVQSGVAVVNGGTHGSEAHMPFGGIKASGNGSREPGTEALDVYSQLKDVYVNTRPPH